MMENKFVELLRRGIVKRPLETLLTKECFNIPILTQKNYLRTLPYVEQEEISCPCGENALVGWREVNGEKVPGTYCPECGYTQIQFSDLIEHEVQIPAIMRDLATALGFQSTASEDKYPGCWLLGTRHGVDFCFVLDYTEDALLRLTHLFARNPKAFFIGVNCSVSERVARFLRGYPCMSVDMVVDFDPDFNIVIDEEQWQAILEDYAPIPQPKPRPAYAFLDRGDFWELTFAGKTKSFAKKRGFDFLHYLIEHPGEIFIANELNCLVDGVNPAEMEVIHDDGDLMDSQALQEIQKELKQVYADIQEEEDSDDPTSEVVLGELYDKQSKLEKALLEANGSQKKGWQPNARLDKIRSNVTIQVRAVLKKITAKLPEMGEHLDMYIKTGRSFSYSPNSIRWSL